MSVKIEIRRNSDGETVTIETVLHDMTEYMWSEGNYSCDCNRSHYFFEARGLNEPETDECGDYKFSVRLTDTENGEVIYDEL